MDFLEVPQRRLAMKIFFRRRWASLNWNQFVRFFPVVVIFFLVFSPVFAEIPRDYRSIALGMSIREVKELLRQDGWFSYRGDASLSMLERPRASLINVGGSLFIEQGLFQFENDVLVGIVLELNPQTIDWYTTYSSLRKKYGLPQDLNPGRVWWEDEATRLALERPLTVKYLDMSYFNSLIADETDQKAWRETARKDFLDQF